MTSNGAGIRYGGDYNPEQWPRATWDEDVALMREAGVNFVSVGIFSWGLLEVSEGVFDFGWLDELLDLMHANGIAVDLGTPTASPPAWFFVKYPHARAKVRDGRVMGFGSRGMASHSSPEYREAIIRIASALADRYAKHPAVVLWHVHNEYGVPVGEDFSDTSAIAFRAWLKERYGSIERLNEAWGTAVWGHTYREWDHVGVPAETASAIDPSMNLDWCRFTDAQLRECYVAERDAIRARATQPITTNFMTNQSWGMDYWEWAKVVDVIADDHYLVAADPEAEIGLAIAADINRSLGGGKPWLLMEHSTSAVNWQERNVAKRPGEMARNSLAHVARGADTVAFFQWRAARYGAEKFHSAILPHAGTESRKWREAVELGSALGRLGEVVGSRVRAEVAMLWDFESFWAQGFEWRPSIDHTAQERTRAFYEPLWRDGVTVDFVLPSHDLSSYKMVVAPAQYLLRAADAAALNRYVVQGGTLVVSYFSAVVDEFDAVHAGGFLAPLEPSLGVRVDEFLPLREGETAEVDWSGERLAADVWQESLIVSSAEVVATTATGPGAGEPAVTRNASGDGVGWYVSTRLDAAGVARVMDAAYADAGITPPRLARGVETVTRHGEGADFLFAINHSDDAAEVTVDGVDLITGAATGGTLRLDGGAVAVIKTDQK